MTASPRLNPDADTLEAIAAYFAARAVQGLWEGYRWEGTTEPLADTDGAVWGARTYSVDPAGMRRVSVYVRASARGRGHLSRYLAAHRDPVVTAPDCDLQALLARRGIDTAVVGAFAQTREYRAVAAEFDGVAARRSGVPYMHHIDEGLAVLRDLGAPEAAWRAWCLHPRVQADAALAEAYPRIAALTDDPRVLCLAMEYRNVANAYLSHRTVHDPAEVALGPLPEVHAMLTADKVQNAKDFVLHHRGTHPRSAALEAYFKTWHARLGVTREDFARWFERLQAAPPRRTLPDDW